jgi:hypothetical protein
MICAIGAGFHGLRDAIIRLLAVGITVVTMKETEPKSLKYEC